MNRQDRKDLVLFVLSVGVAIGLVMFVLIMANDPFHGRGF